ncbi:MAG TPA: alpha-ketoacid dehydrogenase subunit beta, partial [Sulfuricaulis sp.]|nr:alpha-ketoacid dehydrogenase subunit beta [Sulfuricaulis sp.]
MPWDEGLVNSLVYASPDSSSGRILGYVKAINEALDLALKHDPQVFVLGQGVDDPGSMFGTTSDLQSKYGAARVFDTPLSEEGMMGVSVGAAMNGMRPVYMHNRPDFILLAFNQLVTHASKYHYIDNGQTTVPMVVWAAIGRGWGSGAQHSQSIQGLLLGVPGIRIVMPSTPYDAKGLMLAAIADNNPVLIFEHRWLMKKDGAVPEGLYTVPLGKGIYRRRGHDITIVGTSHALEVTLQAAVKL